MRWGLDQRQLSGAWVSKRVWTAVAAATAVASALIGVPASAAPAPGALVSGVVAASTSAAPQPQARPAEWSDLAGRLGLGPSERLVLKDRIIDQDGTQHLRFDRTWRGLRVIAGDLVVHLATSGRILGADRASTADLTGLSSAAGVSEDVARRVAGRSTGLVATPARTGLVVYAVGETARLAYESVATSQDSLGEQQVAVYVDATSGREIDSWSLVPHAKGVGKSLYNGKVTLTTTKVDGRYKLVDGSRGGQAVYDAGNGPTSQSVSGKIFKDSDNVWGNFTASNRQTVAVDAAYGAAKTWDYYLDRFGRHGIRDNGRGARSYVHYGDGLDNAYWLESCFCMVYGDGGSTYRPLVSLDVTAHEMTHGLTNATAGLIYTGESGALSEATSDIFGTAVEFWARNSKDPGDYLIGEEITRADPGYNRRMDHPSLDGVSADCWRPSLGADDVHFSSGPANHFFYLLAEGSGFRQIEGASYDSPTCNGGQVTGIGRTDAAKIWYRALTVHLTSTSGYREARDATIRSARKLFGDDSPECRRVVKAWDAVGVPAALYGCTGAAVDFGPNSVKNGGFEKAQSNWSSTEDVITNDPAYFGAHSGRWYALLNSYGVAHTDRLSQSVDVPTSPAARLRFQLAIFSLDSLTVRHDTFTVSVLRGGSRTVLLTLDNTDAAWSYAPYELDLSAYAGETVKLEFTGLEDDGGLSSFLIDDVTLTAA